MKLEITEVCPHCEAENTMEWDVEKNGYEAFCPHCGSKMMICSECMAAKDNECGKCDWDKCTDTCFRCKPKPQPLCPPPAEMSFGEKVDTYYGRTGGYA